MENPLPASGSPSPAGPALGTLAEVRSSWTPNPNALKFVSNLPVRPNDKVSFPKAEDAATVPLAKALFELPYVEQVHFFDNAITVSKLDFPSWDEAEPEVRSIIERLLPLHDPAFLPPVASRRASLPPELQKIEEILDRTIRPGLQGDGGDLEVVKYEKPRLFISYQGACGSCPSAIGGTLMAIQGILRDEFDPELEIETI